MNRLTVFTAFSVVIVTNYVKIADAGGTAIANCSNPFEALRNPLCKSNEIQQFKPAKVPTKIRPQETPPVIPTTPKKSVKQEHIWVDIDPLVNPDTKLKMAKLPDNSITEKHESLANVSAANVATTKPNRQRILLNLTTPRTPSTNINVSVHVTTTKIPQIIQGRSLGGLPSLADSKNVSSGKSDKSILVDKPARSPSNISTTSSLKKKLPEVKNFSTQSQASNVSASGLISNTTSKVVPAREKQTLANTTNSVKMNSSLNGEVMNLKELSVSIPNTSFGRSINRKNNFSKLVPSKTKFNDSTNKIWADFLTVLQNNNNSRPKENLTAMANAKSGSGNATAQVKSGIGGSVLATAVVSKGGNAKSSATSVGKNRNTTKVATAVATAAKGGRTKVKAKADNVVVVGESMAGFSRADADALREEVDEDVEISKKV